jgi:hypothetical protein
MRFAASRSDGAGMFTAVTAIRMAVNKLRRWL